MKLIARAPLSMVAGRDQRPGDTFEINDVDGKAFVDSGLADVVDGKPDKGAFEKSSKKVDGKPDKGA